MRELQLLAVATFFALIVGGGLFLLVSGGLSDIGSTYRPQFKTVASSVSGPTDVLTSRKNYVFREQEDFVAFWELIYGNDPAATRPPVIAFARDHAIAVVAGVKNTGGYEIYVRDVIETPEERIVEVVMRSPGEGCQVTEAFTNPFQIISVKKTDKPLRAVEIKEEYSCGVQ
ncbi:MAG: protease complex subunit PrcB family protein [Patescibacteria group bacterium UBA2103]